MKILYSKAKGSLIYVVFLKVYNIVRSTHYEIGKLLDVHKLLQNASSTTFC